MPFAPPTTPTVVDQAADSQSSSVHPPETAVAAPITHSLSFSPYTDVVCVDTFRHSGWQRRRHRVLDAMNAVGLSPRRRWQFATCGGDYWVQRNRHAPDQLRIVVDYCHDRFCDVCGRLRSNTITDNARRLLDDRPYKDLTLTVRSMGEPLGLLLARLTRAFRRLRSTPLWKDRVRGGAAFVELTLNESGGGWHPHLHCILDAHYMCQRELRSLWFTVTGDSHVLKIREVRDREAAARYCAKYATKQIPAPVIANSARLREAIETLRGKRLVIQFGTWARFKFLERPSDHDWKTLCRLSEAPRCKHVQPFELRVLRHLHDESTVWASTSDADPRPPPSSQEPAND